VYVDAVRDMGTWTINREVLELEGGKGRIDLNQ